MNTAIICAYNVDSERFLGAEFLAVDAVNEPLRVIKILMEGLEAEATGGYWFVDFHGVPVARAQHSYGLLYLDEGHRVLQAIEVSPNSTFEQIRGVPMSALVVSSWVVAASRTKAGDQLALSLVRRTSANPASTSGPQTSQPNQSRPRIVSVADTQSIDVPGNRPQMPIHSGPLLNTAAPIVPPANVGNVELEADAALEEAAPEPAAEQTQLKELGEGTPEVALPTETESKPREVIVEHSEEPEAAILIDSDAKGAIQPATSGDAEVVDGSVSAPALLDASESIKRALEKRTREREYNPWSVQLLYSLFPELHPSFRPDFVAPRADSWREKDVRNFAPAPYVRILSFLYPELKLETVVRQQREKRRAPRIAIPGLVGHYFSGGTSFPKEIRNLSLAGFFMCTQEHWLPGTIVRVTLQKPKTSDDDPEMSLTVNCRVVNVSPEGTGFEFVLPGLFDE